VTGWVIAENGVREKDLEAGSTFEPPSPRRTLPQAAGIHEIIRKVDPSLRSFYGLVPVLQWRLGRTQPEQKSSPSSIGKIGLVEAVA
jgi:hypothetical protein